MSVDTGLQEINNKIKSFLPTSLLAKVRIVVLDYEALLSFDTELASEYSVIALLTEKQEQQLASTGRFKALTVISIASNTIPIKNSLIAEIINEALFFMRLDPATEVYFSDALKAYNQNIFMATKPDKLVQTEILARVRFHNMDVIYPSTLFKWMTPTDCAKVFSLLYAEVLCCNQCSPVSFNIDCESLLSDAGFNTILNALDQKVVLSGLILELTESEIFTHKSENELLKERLHLLKQKGVKFSLDDFGKRQSNYDRLHDFMGLFSQVKIDRKLFSNLTKSNNLNTSVQRLMHLMSALPHEIEEVVIEGIENEDQLKISKSLQYLLERKGSNLKVLVQGFYLDHPSPLTQAVKEDAVV